MELEPVSAWLHVDMAEAALPVGEHFEDAAVGLPARRDVPVPQPYARTGDGLALLVEGPAFDDPAGQHDQLQVLGRLSARESELLGRARAELAGGDPQVAPRWIDPREV